MILTMFDYIPDDLYKSYFESVEKRPVSMWLIEDFTYFEYEGHIYIIPALPCHSYHCPCTSMEDSEAPNWH
jgi:hypothetical protein